MRAAARDDYAEFGRLAAPQPFSGGDDARHPRGTGGRVAVVHAASGNLTAARARRADFPAEFRARLHREPCHPRGRLSLAMAEARLGRREEAVRLAEKATELLPEARDAVAGARNLAPAAEIFAWTGDRDRAIALRGHVNSTPGNSPLRALRVNPALPSLRGAPHRSEEQRAPVLTCVLLLQIWPPPLRFSRRPASIWRVPNSRPVMAAGLRPRRGVEPHRGSV